MEEELAVLDFILANLSLVLFVGGCGLGVLWFLIGRDQRLQPLRVRAHAFKQQGYRTLSAGVFAIPVVFSTSPGPFAAILGGTGLALVNEIPQVEETTRTLALAPPEVFREGSGTTLLLFIHGWNGDREGTWLKFPSLAAQDPRLSDAHIWVLDYPTYMWKRNLNIIQLAKWFLKWLDAREVPQRFKKVVIIAHSMGGLIARELIILKRLAEQSHPFGFLIEVASPHNGANYTRLASALGLSAPLTEEMQEGSSFLVILQTQWNELKSRPKTYCYTSPHDDVVPQDSAAFQCDDRLDHPQWGHIELVKPDGLNDPRYDLPMFEVVKFIRS